MKSIAFALLAFSLTAHAGAEFEIVHKASKSSVICSVQGSGEEVCEAIKNCQARVEEMFRQNPGYEVTSDASDGYPHDMTKAEAMSEVLTVRFANGCLL